MEVTRCSHSSTDSTARISSSGGGLLLPFTARDREMHVQAEEAQKTGGWAFMAARSAQDATSTDDARPRPSFLSRALLGLSSPLRRTSRAGARTQRRPREPAPEQEEQQRGGAAYWSKRQRNNEAARRSRERRRAQELELERRALELLRENERLRAALRVFGCCSRRAPPCAPPGTPGPVSPSKVPEPPTQPQAPLYRPWTDSSPAELGSGPGGEGRSAARSHLPHKLRLKSSGWAAAAAAPREWGQEEWEEQGAGASPQEEQRQGLLVPGAT